MSKKFFITTPIYYSTDVPHLGTSYTTIATDVYARFLKSKEKDIFFLTGVDEHGAKVAESAQKNNLTPEQLVEKRAEEYKSLWQSLNIEYSQFARTTDPEHEQKVKDFLQTLYDKEFIYKGEYKGLYCIGCEEFKLSKELIDGKCPLHDTVPEEVSEPTYFFKLSAFGDQLLEKINSGEFVIEPVERKNEVVSFIKGGLNDIAISRKKVQWGIKCPWDESHTIYVWIDALLNYWTFSDGNWPADLQFIGKDILRFHAIIWPALLLAKDEQLPKKIFAHGYFTSGGKKMSKTLGNKIDPLEIIEQYSADTLRYYILREIPFGSDGDVSIEGVKVRYNADLANTLGNLIQRTLTMAEKFDVTAFQSNASTVEPFEQQVQNHYQKLEFHLALEKIIHLASKQNVIIDETKPWDLIETDREKVKQILGDILIQLQIIGRLLLPVMPATAQKIIDQVTFKAPKEPIFPKKN